MKRIIANIIVWACTGMAFGQVVLPQVRVYESRGWSVQHSVMSWDSLSVYFSAKEPGAVSYDLYVLHAEGLRWGSPSKIQEISTGEDELWPSISSDERMLFYVHRVAAVPGEKNSYEKTQLWRAWYNGQKWHEAAALIISGNEDSEPRIGEDNQTLLFKRRAESKKHDGAWQNYSTTMMDDHNWTIPEQYVTEPNCHPIYVVRGSIIVRQGGRPLSSGRVLVYDALSEQLLQTARVQPENGTWKVALQPKRHYRLALTAEGYSHHYIDMPTEPLSMRKEIQTGVAALDNELKLRINTYDAENQLILNEEKRTLPLGKMHSIALRHKGYEDTTLVVNTMRPTVFTETELDIPLRAKKSVHHFVVTNAKTQETVSDASIRLNGKPSAKDTALRLDQELALQVSSPGFLFYDTLIRTGNETRERIIHAQLVPIEKDLVLQIRAIQFEYDSYELTENSNEALENLAQMLFMNPTLHIELSAHTDDLGSDRYNDKLSTMRGESVAKWLINRGLEEKRIVSKGYGKRKPLVANDSEENRALNRRVEIKVTDF